MRELPPERSLPFMRRRVTAAVSFEIENWATRGGVIPSAAAITDAVTGDPDGSVDDDNAATTTASQLFVPPQTPQLST